MSVTAIAKEPNAIKPAVPQADPRDVAPAPAAPAAGPVATRGKVVISVNAAWNLANFRSGLIEGLRSAGYEIVAVAPDDEHARRLERLGCRFLALDMDNKGANPVKDAVLFARYLRLLSAERPVAFLGYTIKPNVFGSLAAQRLGIPVINNISGLGTAFIRETWLTPVVKALYRTSLKRSEIVFFQNADDRSMFVDLGLVRSGQTAILPGSGVDVAHFAPWPNSAPRSPAAGPRFLLVARLLWDKGIAEFVEAARAIKPRHPAATFALLGFLDVENRTAVSRRDVERWVGEGIVEYLGSTDDVRPHIAAADCVVLPSYREGTSRTLLEGAAMGKPLIATDVPGCRNVVDHGRNGFLCRPRDAEDLARQMEAFLSLPPEQVEAMGRQSRRTAETEFDERLVVERYLETLRTVTASSATT